MATATWDLPSLQMEPTECHFQVSPELPLEKAPHNPHTGGALPDAPLSLEFHFLVSQISCPRHQHIPQKTHHKIHLQMRVFSYHIRHVPPSQLSSAQETQHSPRSQRLQSTASHIPELTLLSIFDHSLGQVLLLGPADQSCLWEMILLD